VQPEIRPTRIKDSQSTNEKVKELNNDIDSGVDVDPIMEKALLVASTDKDEEV
jgi:hypothetical protein